MEPELSVRRGFVDPADNNFSIREQCDLIGVCRSGIYYKPTRLSDVDLVLMRAIDKQYTATPFYGRRRMTVEMNKQGFDVGQKHVRTLMRLQCLEAIYPKPNLSKNCKEHKKYPYLIRGMKICGPNHVWAADITYIPLQSGFGYLFAIMDWFSRYVIEWQLSSTLETDFCLEALERALTGGRPQIFNTDQGVQFTSCRFTGMLEVSDILISMDGRGRAFDNIMVERLWRSVKYEDVYPKGYHSFSDAEEGLKTYFGFYNKARPHQGLKYQTPAEVYGAL